MPDLCPKGADLAVKTSAASCSLTFPVSGAPNRTGWELGHPPRRGYLSLGRNSNSTVAVETIETIQKVHRRFMGLTLLYATYLERCNVCLVTDADSWLKNSSFGRSYYFWRWMAWGWDRGKREPKIALLLPGSQAVPMTSQTATIACLNKGGIRTTLPDVFLKDSSQCTLRL